MTRKAILFSLFILLILALSNIGAASNSSQGTLDPKQIDGSEFESIPAAEDAIKFFQARLKTDPRDAVSYTLLAGQYIRQARETGDAAGYQRAQAALEESLRLVPNYGHANATLAAVYYAQHDFIPALELAQQTYEKNPNMTDALLTIGDAQLALGNYQEAEAAYQELNDRGDIPPVLARLATLEELKGHPQQALDLMRDAAHGALQSRGTRENVAWYVLRVGDIYYNMGEIKEAGTYYEASLRVFDNYPLALAGLGKVRAAEGRYDEAIAYYQQAINIVPQPDFLAALGDIYTVTDQPDQARIQYGIVEYIGKLAAINRQIYNRQLANFYSDHDLKLNEALHLALTELKSRKDIYGYDAAAWAEFKNGNFEEAQSFIERAMTLGTRDAQLYFHAGMIALELGHKDQAREYLEEALVINPHFSILYTEEARRTLETLE